MSQSGLTKHNSPEINFLTTNLDYIHVLHFTAQNQTYKVCLIIATAAARRLPLLVVDRDVDVQRVLGVHALAAKLALVLETVGKVYALHVIEDVVLLQVGLAADAALVGDTLVVVPVLLHVFQ